MEISGIFPKVIVETSNKKFSPGSYVVLEINFEGKFEKFTSLKVSTAIRYFMALCAKILLCFATELPLKTNVIKKRSLQSFGQRFKPSIPFKAALYLHIIKY